MHTRYFFSAFNFPHSSLTAISACCGLKNLSFFLQKNFSWIEILAHVLHRRALRDWFEVDVDRARGKREDWIEGGGKFPRIGWSCYITVTRLWAHALKLSPSSLTPYHFFAANGCSLRYDVIVLLCNSYNLMRERNWINTRPWPTQTLFDLAWETCHCPATLAMCGPLPKTTCSYIPESTTMQ